MGCGYKECDPYKKNGNKEHFSAAEGEALKLFPPFQNSTSHIHEGVLLVAFTAAKISTTIALI